MYPQRQAPVSHAAFSLVEVAMVIVIVGLIVGGVFVGSDLRKNAELRAIITEWKAYEQAATLFKSRYYYLPGDMRNATAMFTYPNVINGNGDGLVSLNAPTCPECNQFWVHLKAAGFIEQEFDGTFDPVTLAGAAISRYPSVFHAVKPASLHGQGGSIFNPYVLGSTIQLTGNSYFFLTGKAGRPNSQPGYFLHPMDAWWIDEKIDDGLPLIGRVVGLPDPAPPGGMIGAGIPESTLDCLEAPWTKGVAFVFDWLNRDMNYNTAIAPGDDVGCSMVYFPEARITNKFLVLVVNNYAP